MLGLTTRPLIRGDIRLNAPEKNLFNRIKKFAKLLVPSKAVK